MKAKKTKRFLTVPQAAKKLGVTQVTVRLWIRRGRFPVVERGKAGRYLLPASDVTHKLWLFTCRWCGKKMKTRRPLRRRYCCLNHRQLAFMKPFRKYAKRGRPPKAKQ